MARRAPSCTKRLSYVSKNTKDSADVDTSNDDVDEAPPRKKVRKELSVSELKKDSEYFKRDEDHIYSKGKEDKDVRIVKAVKCTRLPHIYLTRSAASMRSQNDDSNAINCNDEEIDNSLLSGKRQRCSSKNAVMARLNRERKKQYISSLESTKNQLLEENCKMIKKVDKQEKIIAALQYEVKYLKSMLANSKEISDILKNLTKSTGLPVTSSLHSLESTNSELISLKDTGTDYTNENVQSAPCTGMTQPFIKRVTSGANFPILQKDVNFGLGGSVDGNDSVNPNYEESDTSLSPYSDLSLDNASLSGYDFDFDYSMFDNTIDSVFLPELENINQKDELLVGDAFQNENGFYSDAGLCLHVNNKKISVELCSLCNSKAQIK